MIKYFSSIPKAIPRHDIQAYYVSRVPQSDSVMNNKSWLASVETQSNCCVSVIYPSHLYCIHSTLKNTSYISEAHKIINTQDVCTVCFFVHIMWVLYMRTWLTMSFQSLMRASTHPLLSVYSVRVKVAAAPHRSSSLSASLIVTSACARLFRSYMANAHEIHALKHTPGSLSLQWKWKVFSILPTICPVNYA